MSKLKFAVVIAALLSFVFTDSNAQIKIKKLPDYKFEIVDSVFHNFTDTRKIVSLHEDWKVSIEDDEKKAVTSIPSTFKTDEVLIFERDINLTQSQILNNRIKLQFLGINYAAEISLNGLVIHKNPGGEIPFIIELPRDILKSDSVNTLSLKVLHELDAEATIPLSHGIYMPENWGGIFRDVLMILMPDVAISGSKIKYTLSEDLKSVDFDCFVDITKEILNGAKRDTLKNYKLEVNVYGPDGKLAAKKNKIKVDLNGKDEVSYKVSLDIKKPKLWSPDVPQEYLVKISLYNDSLKIDETVQAKSLYSFKNSSEGLVLNGNEIKINGVTYFQSYGEYGSLVTVEKLRDDLKLIKDTGFNTVRFSKTVPHPYALRICEKIGLLTFVEIPLNSVNEDLSSDQSFRERAIGYSKYFIESFEKMTSFSAIGLGSSYLSNSAKHNSFLHSLAEAVRARTNKLIFTSFIGFPEKDIENVDLFGIEVSNNPILENKDKYDNSVAKLGKEKIIITEATYSTFNGSTSGYDNDNSFEAQAKYFEEIINFSANEKLPAYFVNTMFDFRGEYAPFSTGFNEQNIYQIGIVGEDRLINRISYKVINNKLKKGDKVTIPMGDKTDDSPIFFVLIGLGIALVMGLLINSKRKFREDASRALLRPYNFYADIRDQRILSGFHSNFLMVILAGSNALFLTNMFYFLRTNFLLDQFVEAFGIYSLKEFVSYVAWNPLVAFPYLFAISIVGIFIISVMVYISSFFVKNRVLFSSVYYMVTWSFLPLALLIPVELVLYRILVENIVNVYAYYFVILYALWLIQRLFKGVYVIFDVRPFTIYFYCFVLVVVVFGGILFYFQLSEAAIFNIINAYKQFVLM
ncbi:MAG: hypothetical protein JEY94_11420 [Melioribacteraceae bacterium]|nr:hypothetical protein [Melioribacteraceae bacterium]